MLMKHEIKKTERVKMKTTEIYREALILKQLYLKA